MNQEEYQLGKKSSHEAVKYFVGEFSSLKPEDVEDFIFHYVEHDEPQLAYSNLVAMIISSSESLSLELCQEIIKFGKDIQMQNGVLWDREEAEEWWDKLTMKCSSGQRAKV